MFSCGILQNFHADFWLSPDDCFYKIKGLNWRAKKRNRNFNSLILRHCVLPHTFLSIFQWLFSSPSRHLSNIFWWSLSFTEHIKNLVWRSFSMRLEILVMNQSLTAFSFLLYNAFLISNMGKGRASQSFYSFLFLVNFWKSFND